MKVSERHRALADAQLIHQIWQDIHKTFDAALITATVKKLIGRPNTPSQIDDNLIQDLPDTPGSICFTVKMIYLCMSVRVLILNSVCYRIFQRTIDTAKR